jgi:hypothetical protein
MLLEAHELLMRLNRDKRSSTGRVKTRNSCSNAAQALPTA